MNSLFEEVRNSFESAADAVDGNPITVLREGEIEVYPGLVPMKQHYEKQLLVVMRRAYRHFAGSDLPTNSDELLALTSGYLHTLMVAMSLAAFSDGVQIGHQSDYLVKMFLHFKKTEHLFDDETFRASSLKMAHGFAEDPDVTEYFSTYIQGAVLQIGHVTGFIHSEVVPAKVWDVWLLVGSSCVTTSYMAGDRLGASWRERDVLDGIEIASESAGQDGPDQ